MWQHGVARIVKVIRDKIIVLCPFCGEKHTHSRLSWGSKEVVAGCHVGGKNCFSYAIPKR